MELPKGSLIALGVVGGFIFGATAHHILIGLILGAGLGFILQSANPWNQE